MTTKKRFYLAFCLSVLSYSAFSTGHSLYFERSPLNESVLDRCSHIDSSWRCNRTRGCQWDHYRDYCVSDRDDDDYRSCYEINSPLACSNRYDCYWSRSRNRCVSNRGDDDYGSPRICYEIRSRYECERYEQCHWSYSFDRCVGPNDR